MIKLNIVGSALVGTSGYSVHTKNLFKALAEEITDIHLDVPRPPGWELQVTDQELKCMNTPRFNDGITLMIAMPQFWAAALVEPSKKFIGFAVWEGNKVPQHWKKPLQDVDAIAVPSIVPALISAVSATKASMLAVPSRYKSLNSREAVPRSMSLSVTGTIAPSWILSCSTDAADTST